MDNARITQILEDLRQEREKASNVISALETETDRGAQKLLDGYIQRRNNIDAAVLAMDNLASGKRRGRRPGWIDEIREAQGA